MLNYGQGFFGQNQPGAELVRIDYLGNTKGNSGKPGNFAPTVSIQSTAAFGLTPLTVRFTSTASDPEGQRLRYEWDFDADGRVDSREQNPTFTYTENGVYNATLKVTDQGGRSGTDYVTIVVGNTPPTVDLTVTLQPGDTSFNFGDTVNYQVTVTDDAPVDCSRVQVTYILGHDTHGHPQTTAFGCSGSITTTVPAGHEGAANLRGVFNARYTDDPGDGLPALSGNRRGRADAGAVDHRHRQTAVHEAPLRRGLGNTSPVVAQVVRTAVMNARIRSSSRTTRALAPSTCERSPSAACTT